MSTIHYIIKPGDGPSLDRLADSWRYCVDLTTQVLVTFTVTRRHHQQGSEPHEVTIKITGQVRGLWHMSDRVVNLKMEGVEEGRPLQGIEIVSQYDHKTRSGELDWVITH